MVRRQPLELLIGVQIPASQPSFPLVQLLLWFTNGLRFMVPVGAEKPTTSVWPA